VAVVVVAKGGSSGGGVVAAAVQHCHSGVQRRMELAENNQLEVAAAVGWQWQHDGRTEQEEKEEHCWRGKSSSHWVDFFLLFFMPLTRQVIIPFG